MGIHLYRLYAPLNVTLPFHGGAGELDTVYQQSNGNMAGGGDNIAIGQLVGMFGRAFWARGKFLISTYGDSSIQL